MRLIGKVGAWLDHRLKLGATIRETAEHPVPRNTASWLYVFGSAALTVFLLQIVTGILLALIYVPSAGEAWNSLHLDTLLGSGNQPLTPAQAQQVALARLIIADPHTLVLDEATSLIDPRTARTLEGSMSALLEGRTVVAIAHRLHTAHDADRIAVVIDGRIVELGSHHELVAAGRRVRRPLAAWTS